MKSYELSARMQARVDIALESLAAVVTDLNDLDYVTVLEVEKSQLHLTVKKSIRPMSYVQHFKQDF